MEYNWQRQNGYGETGTSGALSIGAVDHRFLTIALGLGLARTFPGGEERCGHVFLAAIWRCQALRDHSNPTARVRGSAAEPVPTIGYGARNSAAISLGACRHSDHHWNGTLHWFGDFARARHDHHLSAQLCYGF
jgi:uncharacterized protein with beta-barrel porin domain